MSEQLPKCYLCGKKIEHYPRPTQKLVDGREVIVDGNCFKVYAASKETYFDKVKNNGTTV